MKHPSSRNIAFSLLLGTALLAISLSTASAQDIWIDATGDWFTSTNWSDGAPPNSGRNAQINNGGSAQVNSGNAAANNLALGNSFGNSGGVLVHNSAMLETSNDLVVGRGGSGAMEIRDSGIVFTDHNGVVGQMSNSGGTVLVTDMALWRIFNNLAVGDAGNGLLTIEDEGQVHISVDMVIGRLALSTGTVDVSGSFFIGSNDFNLSVDRDLIVADSGDGTLQVLDIHDGGRVGVSRNAIIGDSAGSNGLVIVGTDGPNSESYFFIENNLAVGNFGTGELRIFDGGFAGTFAGDVAIGRFAGSNGLIWVDGSGAINGPSLLTVGDNLWVGGGPSGPGGDGTLRITHGGEVDVTNNMTVWGGTTGVLEVDNTYVLNVGGTLFFDSGGILRFLEDTNFINNATLSTTYDPNGVMVDSNGTVSTISSMFSGPGGLNKIGAGTVFMTNSNSYFGQTNVKEGALIVNGSIASFFTDVFPGAHLGGEGFTGDLSNRGVVAPGALGPNIQDPGTLHVNNHYNNASNGTFRADIGGLNEGVNADLLTAVDFANIAGGTIEVLRFGGFNPAPGDRVTVIRSQTSRMGAFATLVPIGWLGLIQPTDVYDNPFTVDILFVLNPFVSVPGLTENQNSVAEALDEAFSDECLPLSTFTILGNIPVPHLPSVYDLIAPEELAAMYEISFSRATVRSQNLQRRMDQIRDNAGPNCGPIVELAPQPISDKNVAGKDVVPPAPAPAPESRWGTFAMGSGDFVTVHDDDGNADGYKIANGSFLGGLDYRLLRSLALGVYGGYAGSEAELNHHGRITTDGGTVGGYATFFTHGFYLQGAGGGTWNEYQNQRTAFLGSAQGHTNGDELNAMGAGGYDWSMNFHAGEHDGSLTIGPTASIQYTDLDIDGYSEHGSLIPLEIQGHSEDSLRSTIGAKAMVCLQMPHGAMLRPEVRVAWLHEYSDNRYSITSRFIGCEGLFRVHGPRVGEDAALVNGGLTIQMTPMLALFGHYDGIFGRDNYDSHSASGGLALSF